MQNGQTYKTDLEIEERVKNESWYWYPVIMGIVTRKEIEYATAEDIQFYNALVVEKQKLMGLVTEGDEEDG